MRSEMDKVLLEAGDIVQILKTKDARIQELLEANNRYQEDGRVARRALRTLRGISYDGEKPHGWIIEYIHDKVLGTSTSAVTFERPGPELVGRSDIIFRPFAYVGSPQ
ncbi:MAG: hypothetical protein ACEQSB_00665 [Undibacterium sp.]